jgi:drug/metabolite transporter (DMT)-like permease
MNQSLSGAGKIALSFFIWSTWAIFFRGLGLPVVTLTFYLTALTAPVAWICAKTFNTPLGKPTIPLFLMGAALLLNDLTFFYAIEKTTVANALFAHHLSPVFVAVLAPLLIKEKPLAMTPVSVGLSLFGLYLILPEDPFAIDGALIGSLSGVASALIYGCLVIMMRKWAGGIDRLRFIFWQNLTVALLLLPFAVFGPVPQSGDGFPLFILASLHSVVVPLIYLSGIRVVSAQVASIMGYIEPLGAVLLAGLLLGEKMPQLAWLGGILIISGGALLVYEETKRNARASEA